MQPSRWMSQDYKLQNQSSAIRRWFGSAFLHRICLTARINWLIDPYLSSTFEEATVALLFWTKAHRLRRWPFSKFCGCVSTSSQVNLLLVPGTSPVSRDREGKIKIRGQGFRRNSKAFSGRNHKFSDQKQVISKKKRSSPKSEGFLWPKSQILTFFPPKNTNFFLPKKCRGGQEKNRGTKTKIGGALPPRWRRACLALSH